MSSEGEESDVTTHKMQYEFIQMEEKEIICDFLT